MRTPKNSVSAPRRNSLSMQIYAAMLGNEPSFEKPLPTSHPRLKMRVKLEAKLEHFGSSPFHRTSLREHVERCAAYAVRAIDDARDRLHTSRPKPIETLGRVERDAILKPIILVGRSGSKADGSIGSRAA